MLEAIFALFIAIAELLAGLLQALAGIVFAGGEALSVGTILFLLAVMLFELVFWAVLWLFSLLRALILRRQVTRVARPIFWRPKIPKKPASKNPPPPQ